MDLNKRGEEAVFNAILWAKIEDDIRNALQEKG